MREESHPVRPRVEFRREAVRHAQDPGQLDAALQLTTSRMWLGVVVVGTLLLGLVLWSVFGRIPIRAHGLGVVLERDSVVYDVVAPSSGVIEEISVEIGQSVRAGDRLARLSFPSRDTQRTDARKVWHELAQQLDRQREYLERDIPIREEDLDREIAALEKDRDAAEASLQFLTGLEKIQKDELAHGYITRQQLEKTVQDIRETESSERRLANEIRTRRAAHDRLVNEQRQTFAKLEQEVLQAENHLRELETAFRANSDVTSPVDGTVVEVSANPGNRIESGARVVLIEEAGEQLELVAFFQNGDGKKLRPGMRAQVAPASVQQNVYGTIDAQVRTVHPLPAGRTGIQRVLGESVLTDEMIRAGAPIQASIVLDSDPSTRSGLAWTSSGGPPVEITPGTQAAAAVLVRQERPIALLLPIFQTWTGIGR